MKKFLALLMLVVMMMSFAACSKDSSSVDVGIVLPTKDEPRWVQDETRFHDALKDSEYTTEILFSQGSSAKEKENVEILLSKGIDVLIIAPHDGPAAGAAVEAAKKDGVSLSMKMRDLVKEAIDIEEDVSLASFAAGREKTFRKGKALKHEDVW